jgi:glycosyltransferase involved in cell wall biosynthesis
MAFSVLNVMFSRGLGGIEQAWADYSAMLASEGFDVVNVAHRRATMPPQPNVMDLRLSPIGNWDVFAIWRLRHLLKTINPQAVLCHGNRSLNLVAAAGCRSLIFIAHNYHLQHVRKAHAVFAITEDLRQTVIGQRVPPELVRVVPNCIDVGQPLPADRKRSSAPPLVIGAMGRMVAKKGFAEFITALALLRDRSVNFCAVIGGEGEEAGALAAMARRHGLEDRISFPGWISDKAAFFRSIDIFCLPSLHEPFGIVALEAMAAGLPIVSTATEGPREILGDDVTALLAAPSNPTELADRLYSMLADGPLRQRLAQAARHHVETRYDRAKVAEVLGKAVREVIARRSSSLCAGERNRKSIA